jgi:hypothetical protein
LQLMKIIWNLNFDICKKPLYWNMTIHCHSFPYYLRPHVTAVELRGCSGNYRPCQGWSGYDLLFTGKGYCFVILPHWAFFPFSNSETHAYLRAFAFAVLST